MNQTQRNNEFIEFLEKVKGIDPAMVRLSAHEVSLITGLAIKTLEAMRVEGRGPVFMKLGRKVQYRLSDIKDFMQRNTFTTTRAAKTVHQQRVP